MKRAVATVEERTLRPPSSNPNRLRRAAKNEHGCEELLVKYLYGIPRASSSATNSLAPGMGFSPL